MMPDQNNSLKEKRDEQTSEKGWQKILLALGEDYVRGLVALAVLYVLLEVYQTISAKFEQLSGLPHRYILLVIFIVPVVLGLLVRHFLYPWMEKHRTFRSVLRGEERIVKEFSLDSRKGFPVALMNWPNEKVRSYCVITSTYPGPRQNSEFATVFIPNTPDVSSGLLKVVSFDELEIIDWTLAECMRLHVTYGTQSPGKLNNPSELRPDGSQV